MLPLGTIGGYKFGHFTKSNSITKNHILQYFIGDNELMKYLPNDIKLTSINRELLLSVSILLISRFYIMLKKKNILSCTIYLRQYLMSEVLGDLVSMKSA